MKLPPVTRTVIDDIEPITEAERKQQQKERVDQYLAQQSERKKQLLDGIVAECRSDPLFLDRVLKELKPLRGQGRAANKHLQEVVIRNIVAACPDWRVGELVETIAKTLNISESHARRLYDDLDR